MNDPVVTADGLVGKVTTVAPQPAQVTLLTDPTSAVSAHRRHDARRTGIVSHGAGPARR